MLFYSTTVSLRKRKKSNDHSRFTFFLCIANFFLPWKQSTGTKNNDDDDDSKCKNLPRNTGVIIVVKFEKLI